MKTSQQTYSLGDEEELGFQYLEIDETRVTTSSTDAKERDRAQGAFWCYGAALFVSGFFLDAIYNLLAVGVEKGFDQHGIMKIVYAVVQVAGLIIMALVDVDINDYLRYRPRRVLCFSGAWVVSFAIWACSIHPNVRIGALIVALPFVYTAFRFKEVAEMRAGFPAFSEMIVLGLVLFTVFLNGMVYLTNTPNTPADYLQGLSYLAGAALMAGVYYWSRRKYQSLTDTLNTGMLVFLLQYGFNWLFWDCFFASYYRKEDIPIGYWLFGLFHFSAALMAFAVRHESQSKLPLGLMLFVSSGPVYPLVTYYEGRGDFRTAGWAFLLTGLLKTGGLLMLTLADLDVNLYVKGHRMQAVCITTTFVFGAAINALYPCQVTSCQGAIVASNQLLWIQCVPWLYYAARFRQVSDMHEGFPHFSELFVLSFALYNVSVGSIYVTQLHEVEKLPPIYVMDIQNIVFQYLSAGITLVAAFHFSPRRSVYSTTVQLQLTIFIILLLSGIGQLINNILYMVLFQMNKERDAALTAQGWMYVPLNLLPPVVMLYFRQIIHRHIGKKWLQLRATRDSNRSEGSARVTSDLGWLAAVEADITTGADLNSYVEEVGTDDYTRLLLACSSSKLDAVQRLLTYDDQRVDVNKGSKELGWTPLFVAAHSGNVALATMLLEYGAAVEQRTNDGQSPLLIASARSQNGRSSQHREVCALLVGHGANAHGDDRWMGLRPEELLGGMSMPGRKEKTKRPLFMHAPPSSSLSGNGGSGILDSRDGSDGSGSKHDSSLSSSSTQDSGNCDSHVGSDFRSTGMDSLLSRPSDTSSMSSRLTGMSGAGLSAAAGGEGSESGSGSDRDSL
jgi:hypothetical protein